MKAFKITYRNEKLPESTFKASRLKVEQGMAIFLDEIDKPTRVTAVINLDTITEIVELP